MINRYASLRQGLVGAWCPSLGASGFRLIDRSGYGNHGTLTNMDPGTDWVLSGGKGALDFDGVNDTVSLGTSSRLTPASITFSCWYCRTASWAFSGSCLFWAKPNGAFDNLGFYVEPSSVSISNHTLVVFDGWPNYARLNVEGNTTFPLNTWTMFSFTLQSGICKIYINGVDRAITTSGTLAITANSATKYILSNSPTYGAYTPGLADDTRIYNRALTPSEIKILYTGGRGVGLMPERIKHRRKTTAAAFKAAWARRQQHIGSGVY